MLFSKIVFYTGIFAVIAYNTGWFFFVLVGVLFWRLVFPAHSYSHRHWEKRILIFAITIGEEYM